MCLAGKDGSLTQASEEIHRLCDSSRHYRIMEVSGGHTLAIYRFALADLLPRNIELVHGPGCPVSVLPTGRLDEGLSVAERHRAIFTTFADVMRVPGRHGSPLDHQVRGADIRIVHSPLDALRLAREWPDREVVFFATGFETTAPSTALTLYRARELGLANFSVFSNHVTIVPAIRAILESSETAVDALIAPGPVSTLIGARPYAFVAREHGKPVVISGFEPLDLLQAIVMILRQLKDGRAQVENQYHRTVAWEGNLPALRVLAEVFELRPYFEWRGLGVISQSALKIRADYAQWDAERRFEMASVQAAEPKAAQCGEVLKGVLKPHQCKLLATECTPERPVGALMVSPEGACAAYYNYVHCRRGDATL